MTRLQSLLDNNRARVELRGGLAEASVSKVPTRRQCFLWIGCADCQVPPNEIVGLDPSELFLHRNLGNLVVHSDLNGLTAIQYAVEVVKVEHIVVCGHHGCEALAASFQGERIGLADYWLRHVRDVASKHETRLAGVPGDRGRIDRLVELNVIEQVAKLCQTTVVRDAWNRGQPVSVHGWIYQPGSGLVRDLGTTVSAPEEWQAAHRAALEAFDRAGPVQRTSTP